MGGRRRKKKKDEVSWGPVPSLLFGTYNLGKELRGKKGKDRRMGRGYKRKRKKEEQQEIKWETEGRRDWKSASCIFRGPRARWR